MINLRDANDVQLVGGKAASLGWMLRAGFNVPGGVVLPTHFFEAFMDASGHRDAIESLCQDVDVTSPESTAEVSKRIVGLLQEAPIPDDVTAHVAGIIAEHHGLLAVRSSAVGEDSERASFAGQLDSFLDIADESALITAVRDCWCSFYSARGLAYQHATGVRLRGMAVIVQTQIEGVVSGVTFTEAPQSAASMLIEYCEGSCEALVSGEVVPESLLIDRQHQGHEAAPQLGSRQVEELFTTFMALEDALGAPQDIEWTIDPDGALHILQARPITTIAVGETAVYSNANINENYPGPVTPFLQSLAKTSYAHYFRNLAVAYGFAAHRIEAMEDALQNIVGVHGQRLYYDVSNIHAVFRMAPFGEVFAQWFNAFVGVEVSTDPRERDVTWHRGTVNRVAEGLELGMMGLQIVQQYRTMSAQVEDFERTVTAFAQKCTPARLRQADRDTLIALLEGFIEIRCDKWLGATLADSACMVCCGALDWFLGRSFDEPSDVLLHGLLRGLPGIVSSEPPKQLWNLSRIIRDDAELNALFERDNDHVLQTMGWDGHSMTSDHRFAGPLQAFLDDWGFRCTGELMMTTTSFQEEPEPVIDMLRAYKDMQQAGPDEVIESQAERRLEQTETLAAQLNPASEKVFRTLANATGASLSLRERARLKQAQLYRCCRRVVLALGQDLADAGELRAQQDVLFLTWHEMVGLREGSMVSKKTVSDRKQRFELESLWEDLPPRIVISRGQKWTPAVGTSKGDAPLDDADGALQGIPAAAGQVTSRATVALGQQDFHRIASGDILVAPQTDPGWATVLFLVQGLVMERGGMLSHGAIIAREFGIPSVVGVHRATERIPDGSTVQIDGDGGYVHVHP